MEGRTDKSNEVFRRADHWRAEGGGGGREDSADLARRHGVSEATIYNWKSKYGGLEVSEAKRLRSLEDENGKLKRLLADAMLDNAALKDLLAKKF